MKKRIVAAFIFIAFFSYGAFAECSGVKRLVREYSEQVVEFKGELTARRPQCIYGFDGRRGETLNLNIEFGKDVVFTILDSEGRNAAPSADGDGKTKVNLYLDRNAVFNIVVSPRRGIRISPNTVTTFQMKFSIIEPRNVVVPNTSSLNKFRQNDDVNFVTAKFLENAVNSLNASYQTDENSPKKISFLKNKSSATVTGTLRRTRAIDDSHYYVIHAKAGQGMVLHLKSVKGAAVMEVFAPDGEKLFDEFENDSDNLLTGEYRIHIFNPGNGYLGNARYTLTVSIK